MPALYRGIDVLITIRPVLDGWGVRLVRAGEAGMGLVRPLHHRARTISFRERKIIPHSEFVPVAKHRRAGQGEHETVGEFESALVTAKHRGKPPPDSAIVKLHFFIRTERLKHPLPLFLFQSPKI